MKQSEFTDRVESIKQRLIRTAYLYLDSESMAADAVDEAIFRGYLSLHKLRKPEFFETWLTRILINVCKKELHRRKREVAIDITQEQSVEEFDTLPLKEAVNHLPQELKDVILLRYFMDLTLAQTAEQLSIPLKTVDTRARRALRLLKLELTEED